MKTAVIVATVAALGTAAFIPAHAGDREWATAGKVLAGVAVAGVLVDAFRPCEPAPVVYSSCPPAPVVTYSSGPVVYAPAPPPVVCAPPPRVVYLPAPAVCARPVYYGGYGYAHAYAHGPHGYYAHGHEAGRRW
jgi:hypothetical protein